MAATERASLGPRDALQQNATEDRIKRRRLQADNEKSCTKRHKNTKWKKRSEPKTA